MRKIALLSAALVFALGCNDSSVTVGNENPTGTVGGIVIDAATEMPIAGAMIKIVSASAEVSVTTNTDGVWQATRVPAGSFILNIQQMGYLATTFNATLNGSVGNFPVKNPTLTIGPTGLVKSDGTFSVRIVDEDGAPAPAVKVIARPQVRYVDYSNGFPNAIGAIAITGTSGADGLVVFTGLPNYALLGNIISDSLPIDVPPVKVMASESYSFLGSTTTFSVTHLGDTVPTIILAGPHTPLMVVQSNVDYLRTGAAAPSGSIIGVTGPITVQFNQAINPSSVRAMFQQEDGKPAPVTAMATVSTNLLSISPSVSFTPGARYNLQLHVDAAVALMAMSEVNSTAPFFVAQTNGTNPAALGTPVVDNTGTPNFVVGLTFMLNEPIGVGNGLLPVLSCVAFYEGASFDNTSPPGPFPGNWTGTPATVACSPPVGVAAPALDVMKITPLPETGVQTGFTSKWHVTYDQMGTAGCAGAIQCIRPTSGTKIHLVFSKQPPSLTVRRANGQPVDDKITVTIP